MKVMCAYCNKIIKDGGSISKGKPYHDVCLTSVKIKEDKGRVSALSQTFNGIDYRVLEVLFEPYGHASDGLAMLTKAMKQNWCIITEGLHGDGIDLNCFGTKKKMLDELAIFIDTALIENYGFNVLYILNKGKLINSINQFNIEVSLF
ncbi:MAG: hypothetical protein E3J47_05930 [Candidatus Stahlbacteria bacterium]|nr:MAG: hypothetical protein E3J47_05930 [Candidatus Stahlbacteria bacterium]